MKINEFNRSKGKPAALFDTTHPDWVPTLNLSYGEQNAFSAERNERQKRTEITKIQNETAHDVRQRHKTLKRFDLWILL